LEAFFIEIEEKFVGIEEICNFEKLRRKSVISKNFKGIFEIFPCIYVCATTAPRSEAWHGFIYLINQKSTQNLVHSNATRNLTLYASIFLLEQIIGMLVPVFA